MTKTHRKMQDHAASDPRSVAAQLRGKGDGRGERYLRFEKMNPALPLAAIAAAYSALVRKEAASSKDAGGAYLSFRLWHWPAMRSGW